MISEGECVTSVIYVWDAGTTYKEIYNLEYELVFDILNERYKCWIFVLGIIIIFLFSSIPAILFHCVGNKSHLKGIAKSSKWYILFAFLLTFFVILKIINSHWWHFADSLKKGEYEILKGILTDFDPHNKSFVVNEQNFKYFKCFTSGSKGDQTDEIEGILSSGVQVKILYVDNVVLRLEIAKEPCSRTVGTRFFRRTGLLPKF